MDLAVKSRQHVSRNRRSADNSTARSHTSQYAIEEINAYIAVRDGLIEEAAQETIEATIERLVLANNFVANCLRPTRPLYITQCLPEIDAVRELQRCQTVDARIVKLRARLAAAG